MRYKIEIHSLGYEDTTKTVDAPSLTVAKRQVRTAIMEWADHNALDFDGNWDMPFVRITKDTAKTPPQIQPTKTTQANQWRVSSPCMAARDFATATEAHRYADRLPNEWQAVVTHQAGDEPEGTTPTTESAQVADLTERLTRLQTRLDTENAALTAEVFRNVELQAQRDTAEAASIVHQYTEAELAAIGRDLGHALNLRTECIEDDPWKVGRYLTEYGSKTPAGLARMLIYNILPRLQAGDKNAAKA